MTSEFAPLPKPVIVPPPPPPRAALEFVVEGDARFISHHDTMRALARALARAAWPVAFSSGFNPLPRFSLPLPRSVGMASCGELAVVDLKEPTDPGVLFASLAPQMPRGLPLQYVSAPLPRGTPHALHVEYEVALTREQRAATQPRVVALLASASCPIEREHGPGKPRSAIDIRPFIEELRLDDSGLHMRFAFVQQRSARPAEVLTNLDLPSECAQRVRRTQTEWDMPLATLPRCRGELERTHRGQENHA